MIYTLTSIYIGKIGFVTFVATLLSISNALKSGMVEMMFSAKLTNAKNGIFRSIGGNDDESFSFFHMGKEHILSAFSAMGFTKKGARLAFLSSTHPGTSFVATRWAGKCRYAHLCDGCCTMRSTRVRLSHSDDGFLARFPAKLIESATLTAFRGMFHAKIRASSRSNIKALLPKWFQLREPILLTSGQHLRSKYQFQHFKDKGVFTMLIPGTLQFGVVVSIALKIAEVILPTFMQIDRATNVNLFSNRTGNAVNAGCSGYAFVVECGHSYMPPTQVCSLGLGRATNTLLGRNNFLKYTTQSRSLSSFMGVRTC